MKEIKEYSARSEPRRGDRITGWFGVAEITDVSYGFTIDPASGEDTSPPENLIRIRQTVPGGNYYTFIYQSDIERNLTVEQAVLRA